MLSERQVWFLLEELCVQCGFCLSREANERLLTDTPTDPESFALAVLRAEGLDPESDGKLYRGILTHVARAYDRARASAT
jgi:hypothetical protein